MDTCLWFRAFAGRLPWLLVIQCTNPEGLLFAHKPATGTDGGARIAILSWQFSFDAEEEQVELAASFLAAKAKAPLTPQPIAT